MSFTKHGGSYKVNIKDNKKEKKNYSFDFWFNNPLHDNWAQGGEDYYCNRFYEEVIFNLDIPKEGYIVLLGTHMCHSFNKLCEKYGSERCIGFDMHNPTNHPRVQIKDCVTLDEKDDITIAFCHNDLGSFGLTPFLKWHGQKWATRNIINGGVFLGNNNFNRGKFDIEGLMTSHGFVNQCLYDLRDSYNLSMLPKERLDGYMISTKVHGKAPSSDSWRPGHVPKNDKQGD